ncbi:MAG: nucleotidyltransferase [Bacillota bacterium]|nr:nucleotidyltransferase [Bacillota bacterium]
MKAVGLVVEYNPFHNGHAHHLNSAKELSNADIVIAVMSGNFLQRGEPALLSKWYRANMALQAGVDLVFELPYIFATQKAETFANGAVSILDAAGCDFLCFGSENGDIHDFYKTLEFMEERNETYQENIKKYIKTGVSYPKAQALSFGELKSPQGLVDLSKPNNILGYHYLKAIHSQKSSMAALTVKRKNADYHDEHFASERIASATSIRKALFSTNEQEIGIDPFIPPTTNDLLTDYYRQFGVLHQWENYYPYLQFLLLQAKPNELKEIYEVEEGIENRLIKAAMESISYQEFMEKVKTKRYTWTRLQRMCLHILTNTKKKQMAFAEQASYLRLLGMTENGKEYLNKMKARLGLPLISKLSSYKSEDILPDIKASRIYACALPNHLKVKSFEEEFKQPPIYIR